jgi:class 3 adenylate cyclase/tetratricopeptide (TPR) repeat protein
MQSFAEWLHAVGLERYAPVFVENGVDFDVVGDLSDDDLRGLGLTLGDRKRLLQALGALSPSSARPSAPPPVAHVPAPGSTGPSAERRQLTVLFCDLVGSTELSRKLDPEDYRELVQNYQSACTEVVSRFDGHIAQYLGDGLLVYFGFPLAHEDDAQRAVRAGLGVVEAVSGLVTPSGSLTIRAGIHTGLVVVGEVGSGSSQERLALGDTPNLAARLQTLAAPGTVLVSDQTRRLLGGEFEVRDTGTHVLKGVADPVQVWQAIAATDAVSRFEAATPGRPPPMVGRELEFSVVLHAWARARSGKGQMVLLCGEPGIGKSRILRALREDVVDGSVLVWQHQCSPYFVNSALYPVIARVERGLAFQRDDSPEQRLVKLERALQDLERPTLDASLIGRLLSLPAEERYGALSMSPQKQKDETIRALTDFVAAASDQQPLLMFFEDVHWADPTTLEFLEVLLAHLDPSHVLLVATYRPEFKPQWVGQPHVTALTLSRLDPEHTKAIATRIAGGKRLPAEIIAQIASKTDGIPLFVEELTKTIVESGLLRETDATFELSGPLPALAIPATLRDSLMARLDRLAPVKEVAQAGACIGREFPQELLELISPLSGAQLQHALDTLVASELVFRRGQPPATSYVFKHALIQEAAYDSLLKSKRAQLHVQIASALEQHFAGIVSTQPELLAHHYTAAEMIEQAIPYWKRAGEMAHLRMALEESIAHLERGIGLLDHVKTPAWREQLELDLRVPLGMVWMAFRGWPYPAVETNLTRAWELQQKLGGTADTVRILWGLWLHRLTLGRVRESLSLGEQLLGQAEISGDPTMLLGGLWASCLSHYFLGEFAVTLHDADGMLREYDPVRDRQLLDWFNHDARTCALGYKACAQWMLGYPDSAATLVDEALTWSRSRRHAFDLGWALHFLLLFVFNHRRDPQRCSQLLEEFERLAREQRLVFYERVPAPICRTLVLLHSDRPQEAELEFRVMIPRMIEAGLYSGLPLWKVAHAQAAGLLGRLDEALALVEEALELIRRPGWEERMSLSEALRIKGWLLQRRGETEQAEACLRESIAVARQQGAKSFELRTATTYAQLMKDQGRRTEARDLLQPVYDWFTEGRSTKDHIEAAALLAELRQTPSRTSTSVSGVPHE